MDDELRMKMTVGTLLLLGCVVFVECFILEPNPQPWSPQKMTWQEEPKVDAQGNTVWKDENHPEMIQVLKPKPYDPKTDSIWQGMPLRDIVYVVMCLTAFTFGRSVGYLIFAGGIYALTYYHVLPKDVPATDTCTWTAFFGPLIVVAFFAYATFRRLSGRGT